MAKCIIQEPYQRNFKTTYGSKTTTYGKSVANNSYSDILQSRKEEGYETEYKD